MRRDVHKVINEKPKSNRTWEHKTPRKKEVVLDPAGEQFNEESNHIRLKRQKYRNQRFNVLERFLIRSVGRHWDKVYAEICKVADLRNFHGDELRDYLKFEVATDCWLEGRTMMTNSLWPRGVPQTVRGLYFHPKSGVLMRTKPV